MNNQFLKKLLEEVAGGDLNIKDALEKIKHLPYQDLGFAKIDHHRQLRSGFPEVIFCPGKTRQQVAEIFDKLTRHNSPVLATKAGYDIFMAVRERCPGAQYHPVARCIFQGLPAPQKENDYILVISAGTSDLPVAEEAGLCAEIMGCPVKRLFDVGIAGLHRLLDHQQLLHKALVIIVVAGMEGALASVAGGLTSKPIIAVPTSVGYGASFGGLAALLSMLNSCTTGIGVVNIDNGFGAAALAHSIYKLGVKK